MKNTVTVSIPFSFKGEEHTPSIVLDLDTYVQNNQTIDTIFHMVAMENNIGNYSYEYEVLESSQKHYTDATGLALEFVSENNFDLDGFKQKLKEQEALNVVQEIASELLDIDDLEKSPQIKQALINAYQAGRKA